jgi:hypothetical protein
LPRLRELKNQLLHLRKMIILGMERRIQEVTVAATTAAMTVKMTKVKKAPIVILAP